MTILNKISVLKDRFGNSIMPITTTKAVQDGTGKKLETILEEKFDSNKVVNTSGSVESDNKALNAVQANPNVDGTLAKQINVLNNERGYLKLKYLGSTDFDLVIDNGFYILDGSGNHAPKANFLTHLEVTGDYENKSNFVVQKAYIKDTNEYLIRFRNNSVWQPWQQIATTTKTPFSCTANTGYTISGQDCYTLNGIAYINVDVVKSDGNVFVISQHGLFTSPYFKTYNTPINAMFIDGVLVAPMMYNGGLWNDGGCYITISSATAKKITVKCEVKL